MKPGILACLLLATIFLSCKKQDAQPASSFGFTANNKNYNWAFTPSPTFDSTDAFFRRTINPNTNDTMYVLVGVNRHSTTEMLCGIRTSELKPGTYKYIMTITDPYVESLCVINGTCYGTFAGDITRVTISSVKRNYASGSFGAEMHDLSSQTKKLTIWDGYFTNVPIDPQ